MSSRQRASGLGVVRPPFSSTQPGRLLRKSPSFLYDSFYGFIGSSTPPPRRCLLGRTWTEFLAEQQSATVLFVAAVEAPVLPPPLAAIFTLKASHCHLGEGRFWNRFLAPRGGRKEKKATQTEKQHHGPESRVPLVKHGTRSADQSDLLFSSHYGNVLHARRLRLKTRDRRFIATFNIS